MPIQDSDLLLIEDTSGVSKKIAALKLKQNLAANTYNNYKLLVNKPDYSSRFVYAQNMQASVAPTDYMLVERAGVSYKVNGQQIVDYFPSVPAGAAGAIVDVEDISIDGAWVLGPQPSPSLQQQAVAYGGGKFVAVGQSSKSVHSTDGINWTYSAIRSGGNTFSSVAYGDGKFVTLSSESNGVGRYSTDGGVTWSDCTGVRNYQYKGIAYGNGVFVAVFFNADERPGRSTDGITWTEAVTNNSGKMNAVAYGNGVFIAVGNDQTYMKSTDGNTWTRAGLPQGDYRGVAYGDGTWVAVSPKDTAIIYSTDNGSTWQVATVPFTGQWKDVTYGDGKFVAVQGDNSPNIIIYSTDGITWERSNANPESILIPLISIAYGDGKFVGVTTSDDYGSYYSFTGTGENIVDSTLTLASDENLDLFTVWDTIRMVNVDGDVASYTPVTSTISNVSIVPSWNQDQNWSSFYTTTPEYNQSAAFLPTNIDSGSPQAAYFDGSMTWIPGVPINYTTSVEILDAIEQQWKLNGTGSYTTFESQTDWNLVASGPGTLTQIQIYRPFNPPQTHAFKALRIDGKILINPGETGDPGAGSILTFASPNQDLKFFPPGENVNSVTKEFIARTYSGSGDTQSIKTGFSPDLVWIKSSDNATNHQLFDVLRGPGNAIAANENTATNSRSDTLTSFNLSGFELGADGQAPVNRAGREYVTWAWDAGDLPPVPNTSGSIESSVKSNGNFSIATYTAPSGTVGNQSVGHGLSGTPDFILVKNCTDTYSWDVYHSSLPSGFSLILNSTNMQRNGAFNSPPTALVINVNQSYTYVQNQLYVAYSWKETAGESSFGSYTGGGTPTLNFGFEPSLVIIKRSSSAQSWAMYDNARTPENPRKKTLACDTADAEISENDRAIDFTSTGFTVVGTNDVCNKPDETYVYAAFAGGIVGPEVISTDTSANTMTVDSGTWSNGEVVTGPEKSGAGNFSGNAGAVVDVSNSNQQWITNDNRLGEAFFIKAASTRTGLAILRAEAIKVAQAYDPAKAPYPVRSLVIYEGDYYANAGFAAPGQSKWVDLGRIVGNG